MSTNKQTKHSKPSKTQQNPAKNPKNTDKSENKTTPTKCKANLSKEYPSIQPSNHPSIYLSMVVVHFCKKIKTTWFYFHQPSQQGFFYVFLFGHHFLHHTHHIYIQNIYLNVYISRGISRHRHTYIYMHENVYNLVSVLLFSSQSFHALTIRLMCPVVTVLLCHSILRLFSCNCPWIYVEQ